jgi:hypothetical protein
MNNHLHSFTYSEHRSPGCETYGAGISILTVRVTVGGAGGGGGAVCSGASVSACTPPPAAGQAGGPSNVTLVSATGVTTLLFTATGGSGGAPGFTSSSSSFGKAANGIGSMPAKDVLGLLAETVASGSGGVGGVDVSCGN